jgi:hypothetical protein
MTTPVAHYQHNSASPSEHTYITLPMVVSHIQFVWKADTAPGILPKQGVRCTTGLSSFSTVTSFVADTLGC